ncbi:MULTISPECIES: exonuclease SbcCD subunit D [Eubacterium]|jgi:exonuclease SbcD|uniref:exonuclease SbcCD subunit D n=1 Tax=Eubacterium TaxID=1730 RepID=UPI000E54EAFD|nr:exonuclease SbcCD subunit D [Eubacterium sp. AF19-12LB]RHR33776.1 exonuclease SbcCD subunit D [Eubacterium sp. AF19-12LB]
MRFLHLADLHIGKRVNGFSMIEDQKFVFEQVYNVIENEKIDGIIMAGDIYDKPVPSAEAVKLFDEMLTRLVSINLPIFVISGNHDSAERIGFGSDILSAAKVYMSRVYNGNLQKIELEDDYGKINVYLLPFIKPATVKNIYKEAEIKDYDDALEYVLSQEKIDETKRNVIVSHQFVTGAMRSESEEVSVGGLDNVSVENYEAFDYVALGHIHRAQQMGRESARYAGTLLKYSFSEEKHNKSMTIVDLKEKGNIEIKEIPVKPLHDLKTIKGKFSKITSEEFYKELKKEDYYRAVLTDEDDILNAIGKLKSIYPNLMSMEYDNTRTRSYSVVDNVETGETKSPLDYFEEFFEKQNGRKMSEKQRNYLLEILGEAREESHETN